MPVVAAERGDLPASFLDSCWVFLIQRLAVESQKAASPPAPPRNRVFVLFSLSTWYLFSLSCPLCSAAAPAPSPDSWPLCLPAHGPRGPWAGGEQEHTNARGICRPRTLSAPRCRVGSFLLGAARGTWSTPLLPLGPTLARHVSVVRMPCGFCFLFDFCRCISFKGRLSRYGQSSLALGLHLQKSNT